MSYYLCCGLLRESEGWEYPICEVCGKKMEPLEKAKPNWTVEEPEDSALQPKR